MEKILKQLKDIDLVVESGKFYRSNEYVSYVRCESIDEYNALCETIGHEPEVCIMRMNQCDKINTLWCTYLPCSRTHR